MDIEKTGKFIAQKRKEKSLTQQELADILGISNKTVSKWECGNGLPEVSLMLPLCEALGITVNELLSGESLPATYLEKAEENLLGLIRETEHNRLSNKTILLWHILSLTVSVLLWLGLFANGNIYQLGQTPTPLTLCYLVVGFILIYATTLTGGYAVIRRNGALLFTAVLFAVLACLLICLSYQILWLILPSVAGIVICLLLSILRALKKRS